MLLSSFDCRLPAQTSEQCDSRKGLRGSQITQIKENVKQPRGRELIVVLGLSKERRCCFQEANSNFLTNVGPRK